MPIALNFLLLAAAALAAPISDAEIEQNCLADIIVERGVEMRHLERRSAGSFSYEGETGVSHWGQFSTTCEKGEFQSPINFAGEKFLIEGKPELTWASLTKPFEFLNNGHTLQLQLKQSTPALLSHEINGLDYTVQQVHFHSPSEHHIEEKYFPLEAHFVHATADGKLNVIGLFFEIGDENPWFEQFIDNIPTATNQTTKVNRLNMNPIISAIEDSEFFSYTGSLTTPPCTEGVLWLVAREPLSISQDQLEKLTKVMPFNSRTTQTNKSKGVAGAEGEHGGATGGEHKAESPKAAEAPKAAGSHGEAPKLVAGNRVGGSKAEVVKSTTTTATTWTTTATTKQGSLLNSSASKVASAFSLLLFAFIL
ncbi:alpha carbonic anhydrase [Obelidium mucronatum]|nr:alpha carbonic anhydrase [Obelidium mucronatum]